MSIFRELDVRLDAWEAEYGPEVQLALEEDAPNTRLDVELAADDWHPIHPVDAVRPERLLFIDGVRRIEARLLVRQGSRLRFGALGSFAVGSVLLDGTGQPTFGDPWIRRLIVLGGGVRWEEPVSIGLGLTYDPVTTNLAEADGPFRTLHDRMRQAEESFAREQASQSSTAVVVDGPLTFGETPGGSAIGYVKRIMELHLPVEYLSQLARLGVGERTPLFELVSRRYGRFSWYLRIAAPQPGESDLSGLARLEVTSAVGVARARQLADMTTLTLPAFASPRGRDPRAPQNLLPISALESRLRHLLGDVRLVRRHIQSRIAQESLHVPTE